MKLEFLGTRGYIDVRTERHLMHSACLVIYRRHRVMIDCGEDWLGHLSEVRPHAILVTHAHPDHAFGLRDGAPCPVYATADSWERLADSAVLERRVIEPRKPLPLEGMTAEAFALDHSTRAPAVGYRVTAGRVAIFYVPDVAWVRQRDEALSGVCLYIGDGATMARSMVRKIGGALIGHAPIGTQLTWCAKSGVPRAIFTHCGTALVEAPEDETQAKVAELGRERGVAAQVAWDGMTLVLR